MFWSDLSLARSATITDADACPNAIPNVLAAPLGIDASADAYIAFASATPFARHGSDSGNVGMTDTSTSRDAAATAASVEVDGLASPSKAYGRERRSMAFNASCTAACIMAYMRASTRPLPLMWRHAAVAAFAAFSFHRVTASAEAALGHRTR